MVMSDDKTHSVYVQLTSKIDKVKVYAAGATVTRVANLELTVGEAPQQVEIAGLPLALDDSSVRVRVEGDGGTSTAIATDIRIGLAVPPRQETLKPPAEEEVRQAKAEVQRIEDAIALIDNEIAVLHQLKVPKRPAGEEGKAPPPSPIGARLALANFSDEQIRARIQEKRENVEKLRQAQEHLEDLQQKLACASSAREARPNELRKTVVVRLSYEGEPETVTGQRLMVEYFVPGARWTPTYVCHLDSAGNQAAIALRALLCQRTGEDWSGVRLELSTAEPMAWCELPQLPSLRLGRAQSEVRKSGWRRPPIGVQILFEDFDRQKEGAISAIPKRFEIADFSSVSLPPLPNPVLKYEPVGKVEAEQSRARKRRAVDSTPIDEFDITLISPNMLAEEEMHLAEEDDFGELEALFDNLEARPSLRVRSAPREVLRGASFAQELRLEKMQPQRASFTQEQTVERKQEIFRGDRLAYSLMRMGAADEPDKRGKLSIEQQQDVYLEILQRQDVVVHFNVLQVVQQAVSDAHDCIYVNLPNGGINVRQVAGSFDYAYSAEGRVDVPSDGEFHSVALTTNSTDVDVRYVVVPREDTNVFRIAQLRNPLQAPLLAGPADVYVDGEYILSTNIATVPPKGQMELGLGVEQAIKVARNTTYQEVRSGETLVAFNELRHQIKINIANRLPRDARIEVRERLPIPSEDAKVDVQIGQVSPEWEKYEQQERGKPIKGGYRWRLQVPAKEEKTLSVDYTIKTFVDSELMGGNRRE